MTDFMMTDERLEQRGDVWCVVDGSGGVRPATPFEVQLWKRINELEADLRSAGTAYENMMGVYLKERERIRKLEGLLARASEQMSAWQDPMAGPFERILLDIQEALADD